jgi:hypothetical protein
MIRHMIDDLPQPEVDNHYQGLMIERDVNSISTWGFGLDTTGVEIPDQPDSVLHLARYSFTIPRRPAEQYETQFWHRRWLDFGGTQCYVTHAFPFKSHAFRWKYVLSSQKDVDYLGHLGERLTIAQLYKLDPEARAVIIGTGTLRSLYKKDFAKPDTWWYVYFHLRLTDHSQHQVRVASL